MVLENVLKGVGGGDGGGGGGTHCLVWNYLLLEFFLMKMLR